MPPPFLTGRDMAPAPSTPNPQSFIYGPLEQGEMVLPGWIYTFNTNPVLSFVAQAPSFFVTNNLMPHWTLLVTNRLQVVMLESNRWHLPRH